MNLFHLLDGSTALVLSVVTGTLIPFLSALITKAPSFLTGFLTLGISVASGFVAEWAANPSHYDWKVGAATALGAWLTAAVAHTKILAGTATEAKLQAIGTHVPVLVGPYRGDSPASVPETSEATVATVTAPMPEPAPVVVAEPTPPTPDATPTV